MCYLLVILFQFCHSVILSFQLQVLSDIDLNIYRKTEFESPHSDLGLVVTNVRRRRRGGGREGGRERGKEVNVLFSSSLPPDHGVHRLQLH